MIVKVDLFFSFFLLVVPSSIFSQDYEKATVKDQSLVIQTKSPKIRIQIDSTLKGKINGVPVYIVDTTFWEDLTISTKDLNKVSEIISSELNERITEYQISGVNKGPTEKFDFIMRIWGDEIPTNIRNKLKTKNITHLWIEYVKIVDSTSSTRYLNISIKVEN